MNILSIIDKKLLSSITFLMFTFIMFLFINLKYDSKFEKLFYHILVISFSIILILFTYDIWVN